MPVSKRVMNTTDPDSAQEDENGSRDYKRAKVGPNGTINDKEGLPEEGGELVSLGSSGEAGQAATNQVPFRFPMEVWAKVGWNLPIFQAEESAHDGELPMDVLHAVQAKLGLSSQYEYWFWYLPAHKWLHASLSPSSTPEAKDRALALSEKMADMWIKEEIITFKCLGPEWDGEPDLRDRSSSSDDYDMEEFYPGSEYDLDDEEEYNDRVAEIEEQANEKTAHGIYAKADGADHLCCPDCHDALTASMPVLRS